eukprot:Lithocolla_globosa_v1_NODE_5313_length_1262_cov_1066.448219.p2 type:complete len:355 gc:universal NODE_5313_length_1262_cov_1066.448219:82-1146(+)
MAQGQNYTQRAHYIDLQPKEDVIMATYVWISGDKISTRCKTRTLAKKEWTVDALPIWNFDGSSTEQAEGKDSDVLMKPVAIFRDPFRKGDNILVLTECLNHDGTPHVSNNRNKVVPVFEKNKAAEIWTGIEQEYTMLTTDGRPLGWPKDGFPGPQGPYYCGVGSNNVTGRDVVEAHYKACLFAGIKICGTNAEVMLGQWEYQVGPCVGIDQGDQLWMSRFILHQVAEEFNVVVTLDPKPIPGDWNGAGCHTNYSTKEMRAEGGIKVIEAACEALRPKHLEHIKVYGEGNERRLTGLHETAPITDFSWGVANRGCSIRIPRQTSLDGCGYMEDRRPASNCDPYLVTGKIVETTLG